MAWTEEQIELLSRLWMEGKSASQISEALGAGLSRNAVIGKVHRLGLAGRGKIVGPSQAAPGASRPRPSASKRAARGAAEAAPEGDDATAGAPIMTGGAATPTVLGNTVMMLQPEATLQVAPAPRNEQDVVVPLSLKVTIVDLKDTMCKWPLGDPSSNDFRYCGSPSSGGAPYCAHHGKLAYQPAQDRRRERERDRRMLIAR